MSLREVWEHEHCAYLAARVAVRFADSTEEVEERGSVLSVFRKTASL